MQTEARAPLPEDISAPGDAALGRDERCPLCGHDNACRVARGHLYKGPCWCQQIIVPGHLLARLAENSLDPACLCRPCLETIARLAREPGDTDTLLAQIHREIATRPETPPVP